MTNIDPLLRSEGNAQPHSRALPIIATMGNAGAGDGDKALAAGMDDHIVKPIDVAAMFETLARWLGPGPSGSDGSGVR